LLVLRLVRVGRRNQPKYRLVAADQSEKLNGKVVEILGHYDPAATDKPFVFDKEKVQGWLSKGGMPSNTVAKLLNKNGFDLPVHQYAVAKPKKKAQARLDEANKPSPVIVESEDKEEAPVAVEAPIEAGEEPVEVTATEEAGVEVPAVEEATPTAEEVSTEVATETNEEA